MRSPLERKQRNTLLLPGMKLTYHTLAQESESLFKDKGSRFIGLAKPCQSEAEVKEQLKNWKKAHPQATHLCYAFRVGVNQQSSRYSDDGEPSNSAGAPIFGQLQSFGLTNVLVGVVRYYGGTKLGVGGLIQAYKQAAKEAIEANQIIEKELFTQLEIAFTYAQLPEVMRLIKQHKLLIIKQEQGENCTIQLEIPNSLHNELKSRLLGMQHVEITSEIIGK